MDVSVADRISRFERDGRHGIAERGRYRQRSRDRLMSDIPRTPRGSSMPANVRARPSGLMETTDWLDALEDFEHRLQQVERNCRLNAQTAAVTDEQHKAHRAVTKSVTDDIADYKNYIGKT